MTETDQHACPNCGSTELVSVQIRSLDDELLECQSCKQVFGVKRDADGATRLVRM